jgi:hypothetical protein
MKTLATAIVEIPPLVMQWLAHRLEMMDHHQSGFCISQVPTLLPNNDFRAALSFHEGWFEHVPTEPP